MAMLLRWASLPPNYLHLALPLLKLPRPIPHPTDVSPFPPQAPSLQQLSVQTSG